MDGWMDGYFCNMYPFNFSYIGCYQLNLKDFFQYFISSEVWKYVWKPSYISSAIYNFYSCSKRHSRTLFLLRICKHMQLVNFIILHNSLFLLSYESHFTFLFLHVLRYQQNEVGLKDLWWTLGLAGFNGKPWYTRSTSNEGK